MTTDDEPADVDRPLTFEQAWAEYFARHPRVLASWNHQNGYWPESEE